ncbi:hypothetical protein [Streptomyces sp. NPDC014656]|uniref:hypothetical protein n=1 Tax=Streptomyces sp. NPDC014656 TaxID=3364878 RepID=UPI0036F5187B
MTERATAGDTGREPDEHARFARYRRAFDAVTAEDAPALVTRVLADPDPVPGPANSAVRAYLDRRAAELLTTPGYPSWCAELTGPVEADAFSARRLREWTLLRAMTLGEPWEAEALLAATNWLQLRTAETCPSAGALRTLAAGGRTRRIRVAARARLSAERLDLDRT